MPLEVTIKEAEKYWDIVPALQDMPVNSVIASPKTGEHIILAADSTIEVKGYALPHGPDGPVVRVEVSVDDGNTWQEADLLNDKTDGKWSWLLWRKFVKIEPIQNRRIKPQIREGEHAGKHSTVELTWCWV